MHQSYKRNFAKHKKALTEIIPNHVVPFVRSSKAGKGELCSLEMYSLVSSIIEINKMSNLWGKNQAKAFNKIYTKSIADMLKI